MRYDVDERVDADNRPHSVPQGSSILSICEHRRALRSQKGMSI